MARNFRPTAPFNVPMKLLTPITKKSKGVVNKILPEPEDAPLFFGAFRTFGGSESMTDDVYTVYDTGTIDTWYRPDIKSNCSIYIVPTGETYEIVGSPENINMRNQYLRIRVKKVGGGA